MPKSTHPEAAVVQSPGRAMMRGSAARVAHALLNMAAAFFLVPFMVGQLGAGWYGMWVAVSGVVANFYLADLGFSSAVMRTVAAGLATGRADLVNRTINTALVLYSGLGILLAGVTGLLVWFAPAVVSADRDVGTVQLVMLLNGLNIAASFPFKSFAGIIEARLRQDLMAYADILVVALSTALTLVVLRRGHGVVALSLVVVLVSSVHNLLFFAICRRLFPAMNVSLRHFHWAHLRAMSAYSVWAFLVDLSNIIRFRIDSLVIAALLSVEAVTTFSMGSRLAEMVYGLLMRATNLSIPLLTRYQVTGQVERVQDTTIFMMRIHVLLGVYAAGMLALLGPTFLERWVGPTFSASYPVLHILSAAAFIQLVALPFVNVLYAAARLRALTAATVVEGLANVALSLYLGAKWGLVGVAWGTLLPLFFVQLFYVVPYAARAVGLPMSRLLAAVARPGAVAAATFLVFWRSGAIHVAASYPVLAMAAVGISIVYWPVVFWGGLNRHERWRLIQALPFRPTNPGI
jgi:O-antigen/teichoic acid export membrane protein